MKYFNGISITLRQIVCISELTNSKFEMENLHKLILLMKLMKDNIEVFCSLLHCMSAIIKIRWKLKLCNGTHIHAKVTFHNELECHSQHENVKNWKEAESF